MIRSVFALLLLALPATAQTLPPMVAESDRAAWQAIGRVNIGGFKSRGLCTGTLIAPDRVLTAAHCVWDNKQGAPFQLYRVRFVAGWHKGEHAGTAVARAITVHPAYTGTRTKSGRASDVTTDLAIIELDASIETPPATVGPELLAVGPMRLLGYRRDRPHILTDYTDCNAVPARGDLFTLNCAVVGGTSGAPVFREDDGALRLIGVVVARSRGSGPDKAFAVRVDTDKVANLGTLEE